VVVQLTISAEKLAQSAERLVDATIRNSQVGERYEEILRTPGPLGDETADEEDADLAASQQREGLDVSESGSTRGG